METITENNNKEKCMNNTSTHASGGAVYGLGMIGAAVYFIQAAHGAFWPIIVGILKAMVWPAFLIYYAFQALLH